MPKPEEFTNEQIVTMHEIRERIVQSYHRMRIPFLTPEMMNRVDDAIMDGIKEGIRMQRREDAIAEAALKAALSGKHGQSVYGESNPGPDNPPPASPLEEEDHDGHTIVVPGTETTDDGSDEPDEPEGN